MSYLSCPYAFFIYKPVPVVKDLQALDVDTINVYSNMGGYVNEGLASCNVLKNHSAKFNTLVGGIASWATSVVFMAGDTLLAAGRLTSDGYAGIQEPLTAETATE